MEFEALQSWPVGQAHPFLPHSVELTEGWRHAACPPQQPSMRISLVEKMGPGHTHPDGLTSRSQLRGAKRVVLGPNPSQLHLPSGSHPAGKHTLCALLQRGTGPSRGLLSLTSELTPALGHKGVGSLSWSPSGLPLRQGEVLPVGLGSWASHSPGTNLPPVWEQIKGQSWI